VSLQALCARIGLKYWGRRGGGNGGGSRSPGSSHRFPAPFMGCMDEEHVNVIERGVFGESHEKGEKTKQRKNHLGKRSSKKVRQTFGTGIKGGGKKKKVLEGNR